jgi:hypothetical protein
MKWVFYILNFKEKKNKSKKQSKKEKNEKEKNEKEFEKQDIEIKFLLENFAMDIINNENSNISENSVSFEEILLNIKEDDLENNNEENECFLQKAYENLKYGNEYLLINYFKFSKLCYNLKNSIKKDFVKHYNEKKYEKTLKLTQFYKFIRFYKFIEVYPRFLKVKLII